MMLIEDMTTHTGLRGFGELNDDDLRIIQKISVLRKVSYKLWRRTLLDAVQGMRYVGLETGQCLGFASCDASYYS